MHYQSFASSEEINGHTEKERQPDGNKTDHNDHSSKYINELTVGVDRLPIWCTMREDKCPNDDEIEAGHDESCVLIAGNRVPIIIIHKWLKPGLKKRLRHYDKYIEK